MKPTGYLLLTCVCYFGLVCQARVLLDDEGDGGGGFGDPWDGFDGGLGGLEDSWYDDIHMQDRVCDADWPNRRFEMAQSEPGTNGTYCYDITNTGPGTCGSVIDSIQLIVGSFCPGWTCYPFPWDLNDARFADLGIILNATVVHRHGHFELSHTYDDWLTSILFSGFTLSPSDAPAKFCMKLSGSSSSLFGFCASDGSSTCEFRLIDTSAPCCPRYNVPAIENTNVPGPQPEPVPAPTPYPLPELPPLYPSPYGSGAYGSYGAVPAYSAGSLDEQFLEELTQEFS